MGKLPYEIKPWTYWKVADYPELVTVERQLAEKGLKNPWLRYVLQCLRQAFRLQNSAGLPKVDCLKGRWTRITSIFLVSNSIEDSKLNQF